MLHLDPSSAGDARKGRQRQASVPTGPGGTFRHATALAVSQHRLPLNTFVKLIPRCVSRNAADAMWLDVSAILPRASISRGFKFSDAQSLELLRRLSVV